MNPRVWVKYDKREYSRFCKCKWPTKHVLFVRVRYRRSQTSRLNSPMRNNLQYKDTISNRCGCFTLSILAVKIQSNRKLNTVECRYKAVQYNRISHTALQQPRQNKHRNSYSQKTPHMSPWCVCCEDLGENWPHYNGTGHHNTSLDTTLQWRHNVCSTFCSGANQREHQSSASLASVRGIHRWPLNSPHKGPVTRKMFPFDDVIVNTHQIRSELPTWHDMHKIVTWLTHWGWVTHIWTVTRASVGLLDPQG